MFLDIGNNMSDKIYIGINDKRIEAKGEVLEQILADRAKAEQAQKLFEAEQTKKDADRANAMAKLSKLGLTEEEINAIL
jgi:hypothetical protein